MQRFSLLTLALIIGFCLQPPALFAQDQDQNKKDAKEAKGSPKDGGEKNQAARHNQKGSQNDGTSGGNVSHEKVSGDRSVNADRLTNAGTKFSKSDRQSVQRIDRSQSHSQQIQSSTFAVQGNHANRYNGQWVAADTHRDWDEHTSHHWNHHDYRYYDGGWLMIDIGPSPGYYQSGSIGSSVQAKLARQGYYRGPIDGDIGPGTRNAIAHYESDNGLAVNGRIDEPLLVSLGLE